MRRSSILILFLISLFCLFKAAVPSYAQFKSDAFSQNYATGDQTAQTDSVEQMFSIKEFYRGVTHQQELKIGTLFAGSTVFIGSQQIYHKQYWKLPITYAGIGACLGMGFHYNNVYKNSLNTDAVDTHAKTMSTLCFAGAGLVYWGTLMDGVVTYKRGEYPQAGKATLYSLLLPGLGQAYNGEYWKIPFYWGCLLGAYHFYDENLTNYKRFKRIHNEATTPDSGYSYRISAETALYYRDIYRRYRDYSVLAIAGFYLLQVIDANVFAYMQDFEVNDDLSMHISPTVITPDCQFAYTGMNNSGIGLKLGFNF